MTAVCIEGTTLCVCLRVCVCEGVRSVSVGVCMRLMKSGIGELLRGQPLHCFVNEVLLHSRRNWHVYVSVRVFPFNISTAAHLLSQFVSTHVSSIYPLLGNTREQHSASSIRYWLAFYWKWSLSQPRFHAFPGCLVKQRGAAVSQRRCLNIHVHCCTAGRLSPSKSAKGLSFPLAQTEEAWFEGLFIVSSHL